MPSRFTLCFWDWDSSWDHTVASLVGILVFFVSLLTFLLIYFRLVSNIRLVAEFYWRATQLVNLLVVLVFLVVVLLLNLACFLAFFVFCTTGLPEVAPLTMELTHSVIPKSLTGLAQVVVVFPPLLELVGLALLPVLEALPVRLGNSAPVVPVVLEVSPCALEALEDLLEEANDGLANSGELVAETFLGTWVWVLAAIAVSLGVITTTIGLLVIALLVSGITIVLLVVFYFGFVGLGHDLLRADHSCSCREGEESGVLHVEKRFLIG